MSLPWVLVQHPVALSHDGSLLLFFCLESRYGPTGMYVVATDGSNRPRLIQAFDIYAFDILEPRFNWSGTKIAYVRGNPRAIYIFDLVTGVESQVSSDQVYPSTPEFAPGDSILVYRRVVRPPEGNPTELYKLNLRTLKDEAFGTTPTPTVVMSHLRWSPDGRYVVGLDDGQHGIVRIDAKTGETIRLPHDSNDYIELFGWIGPNTFVTQEYTASCLWKTRTVAYEADTGRTHEIRPHFKELYFLTTVLSDDGMTIYYLVGHKFFGYADIYRRSVSDPNGRNRMPITHFVPVDSTGEGLPGLLEFSSAGRPSSSSE